MTPASAPLNATVSPGITQLEMVTDLSMLELEERLELSSIAADLMKCLQDLPSIRN